MCLPQIARQQHFDIYTRAGITAAQFSSYNPGLDCSKLQIGQKVCVSPGSLPSNAPGPSPNGTCFEYFVQPNDNCFGIATKFTITVDQIEEWNKNTWKWKGCSGLQVGLAMCVSPGDSPPIPIIPGLHAFGFCGLTDEFCTTTGPNPCISNCGQPTLPSCSPGGTLGRYIAYYAGWGNRRTCGTNVAPADVNWEGFTDVKFAFATISQGMEIQLADQDVPLLKELVSQKEKYSSMKVTIALGGWDFSEMEPTRDLFSVMIGTSGNRATFISSVKNMMSTYQLDGIDIDFGTEDSNIRLINQPYIFIEYPGAIERGAPATDTPNLTAFFKELRAGIPSAIVSCATPAGYWFLKGFEIDKIVENVDYLNMMSYDYHGQWDTNVTD
ncbi:hypothetical protein VNI00_009016 [Paramarasmius palmivorus]|uniref:Chitinase n=1 Tax=Paramarasmius palmivorus TaxID=297713 RepID=A0AAW0CPD9_9AGAR